MESYIASGRLFVERYRIAKKLGEGGMGAVYLAFDTRLERQVAIKILPALAEPQQLDRFTREAKAVARLNHPNVIAVFDTDDADGLPFIVMELVEGATLNQVRFQSLPQLLGVAIEIAEALAYAHDHDVIHRDIKPENILVSARGRVKVLDFGLAVYEGAQKITQTGLISGTFPYLAPELIRGAKPSPASDQYALGVVIFELMCGGFPFPVANMEQSFRHRISLPATPLATPRPDLPTDLLQAVDRMLLNEPAARFGSMAQCRAALVAVQRSLGATSPGDPAIPALVVRQSGAEENRAAAAQERGSPKPARVSPPPPGSSSSATRWRVRVGIALAVLLCGTTLGVWIALPGASNLQPDVSPRPPDAMNPAPSGPPPRPSPNRPAPTPIRTVGLKIPRPKHPQPPAPQAPPRPALMRRLSALLEAVECEKIRKLSVELGLKNATEMRVGLAFLQACRMRVTMKNAYAAFSRGDCAKALELYGAVLPLTTANRRQHLERYRASCLRVKQTRLRLKP